MPLQQLQADFAPAFLDHLRKFKLPPSSLQFAIDESHLMRADCKVADVLQVIHDAGVGLAVDGFGTSCSALAMLKTLPLNVLKIDARLVRGLGSDPCDDAVVESIVKIARVLGMQVVADGVETQMQLNLLKNLGCDAYQGALAGAPLQAKALAKKIQMPLLT